MAFLRGGLVGKTVTPTLDAAPGIWSMADVFEARRQNIWPQEDQLLLDFLAQRAFIKDSGTPANDVDGVPGDVLSVTRATGGGYFNSSGQYVWGASSNTLRLDHEPLTGVPKGLLIEGQRTNLLTYSEYDAGVPTDWTVGFGTGTYTHTLVSGFGCVAGEPAIEHECTVTGRNYIHQTIAITNGTTYTLSFYVDTENSEVTSGDDRVVALIGSVTGVSGGVSRTLADADENGRITLDFVATADDADLDIRIGISASGNATGTLIHSCPQVEAGSFASSYIPTTSSAVTRNADDVSVALSDFEYGSAGTVICEFEEYDQQSGTYPRAFEIGDGATSNRISAYRANGNLGGLMTASGVSQAAITGAIGVGRHRTAYAWAADDVEVCIDGAQIGTDGSATIPTVDTLYLGSNGSSYHLNGHIRVLHHFPRRMSSAELLSRSAI